MTNVQIRPGTWVRVANGQQAVDAVVVGYDTEHSQYLVSFPQGAHFPELVPAADIVPA